MHGASSCAAKYVSLETRETATALLTEGPRWPGSDGMASGAAGEGCLQVVPVAAEIRGGQCELEHNLSKGPNVTMCPHIPKLSAACQAPTVVLKDAAHCHGK